MTQTIHAVFPKDFWNPIKKYFVQDHIQYDVINIDDEIQTFKHYMLGESGQVIADIALICLFEDFEIPLDAQTTDLSEYLLEVKMKNSNIRIVLILPNSFKRSNKLTKDLVTLGIYDIHFTDEFNFRDILGWLEKPMQLPDMKEFIEKEYGIKHQVSEKTEESEKELVFSIEAETDSKAPVENKKSSSKLSSIKAITAGFFKNREVKATTKKEQPSNPSDNVHQVNTLAFTQRNIAFLSVSKSAGSTFHANNFASFLALNGVGRIGLFEYPVHCENKTYLSDVFNLYKESEDNKKCSIPHAILNKRPFKKEDLYHYNNVIDIIATDYSLSEILDFTGQQTLKLLNVAKHDVKIMDFGCIPLERLKSEDFRDILSMFDYAVLVMDLMPTALIPNHDRFYKLQSLAKDEMPNDPIYIFNQFAGNIKKCEYKHLNINKAYECQAFERSTIFNAMYENTAAFDFDHTIKSYLISLYSDLCEEVSIPNHIEDKLLALK